MQWKSLSSLLSLQQFWKYSDNHHFLKFLFLISCTEILILFTCSFTMGSSVGKILHGLFGLVRSPVSATLPQIGSRLYVTWGILWSFPETRTHMLVSSLVISWSITEIIRYSFFGMKEAFGSAPSGLLWLRYSTFLVLYPTGITSEVGLIYIALPFIKASDKYCIRMPNKWNFSFDYFYASLSALAIYVPGSPHMYTYMLGQRRKALSKSKKE